MRFLLLQLGIGPWFARHSGDVPVSDAYVLDGYVDAGYIEDSP